MFFSRQQDEMYRNREKRCDDRIVFIAQPHVRPIVRGKAGKKVAFGAKLSVSMVDGLAFVDHIGWDAFNEGRDLQEKVFALVSSEWAGPRKKRKKTKSVFGN